MSYLISKGTPSDAEGYFLGGRSLTAGVIAGSLLLTNLSTEQIVGLNGAAYKEGILVMAWETLAAIAMVITAIYLLPRYLKRGITTIPEFLEERYDKKTRTIASGLFLTGYAVILLPIVLYSGALAFVTMFNMPKALGISYTVSLWLTVWCIGTIGSIYAILGGLKAVAVSDAFNAIGLLIGGILIPIFGLLAVGSGNLQDGVMLLYTSHPNKFVSTGGQDSSIPISTLFTGMMLVQLFYWGTNQAIIQRALGAKNLKEGQKGLFLAAFIKILGPIIVVLPGIIAFHIFGHSLNNPDEAYPALVKAVLPKAWIGFFAAVLFGAILSSFNSTLNSSVTLFGLGIYKSYINKDATESKIVKKGKLFGIGLTVVALFIAPMLMYAPEGLFAYLQEVNGIYSIPILSVIFIGYITKYVPPVAGRIGLLLGSILYMISQFVLKPFVIGTENYPHFLHVMAILFLINVLIMLGIGWLKPQLEAFKNKYNGQVNITPWNYQYTVGIMIGLTVLCIFILFA
jgi:SSS family solute:Na+ symporter